MRGMIAFAVALAGMSGAAMAQSGNERCFNKGTLTYYDCPKPAAQPTQVYAPAPAVAPMVDDSGFYVGARGGLAFYDETKTSTALGTGKIDYDMGYALGGMIGYDFGTISPGFGLRTDLEVGYQSAEVDGITANGGNIAAAGGSTDVIYGFANVYGDIELLKQLDLILGAGAGLGQVKADGIAGTGLVTVDDDDITFGYHLDAGLGYALAPNVTLEAMYRYSSFLDAELGAGGVSDDVDVTSHQALLGLRFGL